MSVRCFALLLLLTTTAQAGVLDRRAADALLPAGDAFALLPIEKHGDTLQLVWNIAPGYYLYRHRILVELLAPTDTALGALQVPMGTAHVDAHFGKVQIHRGLLEAKLPLEKPAQTPLRLRIRFQGCADVGVCYPPQRVMQTVLP